MLAPTDPDAGELPERIWAKIEQTDTCWLWAGGCTQKGYGKTFLDGKQVYVHRVVYEALVGEIPAGLVIDHSCHTRNCCNPDHLEPVTNTANGQNRRGAQVNNRGGARGVHRFGEDKWRVQVKSGGRIHSGGLFRDLDEAVAAAAALRDRLGIRGG